MVKEVGKATCTFKVVNDPYAARTHARTQARTRKPLIFSKGFMSAFTLTIVVSRQSRDKVQVDLLRS